MTKRNNPGCWLALVGLALIALALLCNSCRGPKVITDTRYIHDTAYVERVRVDSLVVRDSTYIRDKGDTLYIYRYHYRDRYRYIHDTAYVARVDSVAYEVVKEVAMPLTWWQRVRQDLFVPLLLVLGLMVCFFKIKD